jgi:ABC-type dipeptide/oligopeptide/nickel transport system permease subunit
VLLVIVIVSLSGYGLPRLIIATAIVFTPVFARIVRAETQVLMTEGFVEYSRALGTGRTKILFRHILPNMIPGLAVRAVSFFPAAIVIDTSLSFLGLGVQPPEPGWGLILKDAWNYFFEAPHIACFSGAALAAALFSLNFISDALAEKLSRHI